MKIEYVDHMGSDSFVVDAARVSFAKQADAYTDQQNHKLLRYLAEHNHWAPFAHPQITFRVKVPIYLARQYFKHIVGSVKNEVSRRYVQGDPEFYWPEWQVAPSGSIKQGSGGEADCATKAQADFCMHDVIAATTHAYDKLLSLDIAPEQARAVLPMNLMTEFVDTGSLMYWARMYRQRTDSSAQSEWYGLMDTLDKLMVDLFPVSWKELTRGNP